MKHRFQSPLVNALLGALTDITLPIPAVEIMPNGFGKGHQRRHFRHKRIPEKHYLYRMAAAVLEIYGNSKEEAPYPLQSFDATGETLDASKNRYALRFAPRQLPPVNAFWSLTMYKLPCLLVTNPLNSHLTNSPMLPIMKRDADGGLTIYVQNEPPGTDKESNWLPASAGPFMAVLRLYWPKAEATNGKNGNILS